MARFSNLGESMPQLAVADVVVVLESEETAAIGIAGRTGMVVGVNIPPGSGEIVGGGELSAAVLVSLDEPDTGVVLIASRLLDPTGEQAEWEIVDGR
jgi:hypothetical protein